MKRAYKRRVVLAVVAICCATILLICSLGLFRRYPSNLLTTPIFFLPEMGLYNSNYYLLSDNSILIYHDDKEVGTDLCFEMFDVRTRKRTPSTTLSRKFVMSRNEDSYDDFSVSGDGQWLVWKGKNQNICFMSSNGHTFFQVRMSGDIQYYWIEKSHQLFVCYLTKEIVSKTAIYDIDNRKQSWLPISAGTTIAFGMDTVVTKEGHLILETDSDLLLNHKNTFPKWLHLEDYVLRPSVKRINLSTISLPQNGFATEIVLSPDGTQVLYTKKTLQDMWLQKQLNRVLPHVPWRIATTTMFLRKATGETLNLGMVSYDALSVNPGIEDVRWLPNGNGFSFVFSKKLYINKL